MIWYWSEILLSTSLGFFFPPSKLLFVCSFFFYIFFKPKSGTGRNLPKSSSIFAYGYCLLFFFLVSFDISNAQTATTDPSEGTTLSLSVYFVINSSFHFMSIYWYEPLKSVYMSCNKPNLYRVGSIWNCSKASTSI